MTRPRPWWFPLPSFGDDSQSLGEMVKGQKCSLIQIATWRHSQKTRNPCFEKCVRIEKCVLKLLNTEKQPTVASSTKVAGSQGTAAPRNPQCFDSWNLFQSSAFPTMVAVRRLETPIETDWNQDLQVVFARICQDSTVVFGKSLSALSGQSLRSLRPTWCFLRFSGSLTLCSDLVFVFKIWSP